MFLDWFAFDSWSPQTASLTWLLTGIVTSLAIILGIVYTCYKRRQLNNEEEKIRVHWPMGVDPMDPYNMRPLADEARQIAASRRAAGNLPGDLIDSTNMMDFPFCPILGPVGGRLGRIGMDPETVAAMEKRTGPLAPNPNQCPFVKAKKELDAPSTSTVSSQCPHLAKTSDQGSEKTKKKGDDGTVSDVRDPLEFCSHIPAEVRKATQRVAVQKIEEEMTEEQKAKERDIQRQQMEAIFKLMEDQQDKFGVNSMEDMQEQMALYK